MIAANKEHGKGTWTPHVSDDKKKVVQTLIRLIKEYPIIGAIDMEGMPAPQLQIMREKLRGKVEIVMTKRRLMYKAIDATAKDKQGIEKLKPYMRGMPALMFTKENPFSVYKTIKENKSPAPAKAGQTAPKDIIIPAGATPFAPGPIIGELGGVGIAAGVENGKVAIRKDSLVVKEGEKISAKLAGILTRLNITPMEIGLNVTAVYEGGVIYDRKVLDIDDTKFKSDLNNAARWAFNLAVDIGHFTKETVAVLIPKAFRQAKALALEAEFMTKETTDELLARAERQALGIKDTAHIEIPEKPAHPPAEDQKKNMI